MIPGASSFLGGDGWNLSAGDERGETQNTAATGEFGQKNVTVTKGGAISMPGLIGIAAVILGGLYLTNR